MTPNKLPSSKSRHERELTCKNRTSNNGGQSPRVRPRNFLTSSLYPKQIQTCRLRSQLGPTSNLGALDILGRVLTSGYVNCRHNIASMGIEATQSSGHGRTSQILEHVELNQGSYTCL
ncbi:NAD(P)-binding Rossmann-fold superfamily protein [Striga asiatica]|uniref:NAD(P)-binding Rossmann-fold superfamily protein n=1 Tax=Striga asiatica TaxID=4170 RepID=A0A5A7REL3_STRAF|nr:NAD(P)-binding Rossmann-fold superfamily protein [Striga asiatica]